MSIILKLYNLKGSLFYYFAGLFVNSEFYALQISALVFSVSFRSSVLVRNLSVAGEFRKYPFTSIFLNEICGNERKIICVSVCASEYFYCVLSHKSSWHFPAFSLLIVPFISSANLLFV